MIARDIMNTNFQTLRPKDTLAEAVNCFYKASAALKRKVFGLMVTDENGTLAGRFLPRLYPRADHHRLLAATICKSQPTLIIPSTIDKQKFGSKTTTITNAPEIRCNRAELTIQTDKTGEIHVGYKL